MEISLEHDGLVMAEPQCVCDSEDCKHRSACVIREPYAGDYYPRFSMRHAGDETGDATCHGDLMIVCTSYRGPQLDGQDEGDVDED